MDLYSTIEKILQKYDEYTDIVIGSAFVREPFMEDFMKLAGLRDDVAFIKVFEAFMTAAHDTFRWNDYLEARMTAEKSFRLFYEQQQYPKDKLDAILSEFIVSFFNQNIDERQFEWEDAHPGEEIPDAPEDDINNLFLSRVFSVIPCKAEDEAFCESIGVRYHYEQLHMCIWFAGQITNGVGEYSRDEINYSARTTYNRLLNPYSLLWIGAALGADKAELQAAAEEMKDKKTNAAKCGVVRKHVPFDTILELYKNMMAAA